MSRFYIRYKPGVSCLTASTVSVAGVPVTVSARTYSGAARAKLHKVERLQQAPGALPAGYVVLEDIDILLSVFPHDRKLQVLTRLVADDSRQHLIRRTLRRYPNMWNGIFEPLRYKPERRYVAALHSEASPCAVFKFYTEPEFERAYHNVRQFESHDLLHIPTLLGSCRRHCVLAFEWISGCVLSDVMGTPHLARETVRNVGRALAILHAQAPDGLQQRTRRSEIETIRSLSAGLAALCPPLASCASELAKPLMAFLEHEPATNDSIHGDCYAKQVLLDGNRVSIVDFDEAMRGDHRADLGLFIAHLERDVLRGTLPSHRVASLCNSLLEGYRDITQKSLPPHLDIYTGIGLFQLAHTPFRHCEPNWPERIEAILARVASLLPSPWTPSRHTSSCHIRLKRVRSHPISVHDPFFITTDPKMPMLAQALDPDVMTRQFGHGLPIACGDAPHGLQAIRVVRYKPKRRCLIAYDVERLGATTSAVPQTILGKVRAKGLDMTTYHLHGALQQAGFDATSPDGVSVPAPVGAIPSLRMWLQRCAPGVPIIERLVQDDGEAVVSRIAKAIHKLHRTDLPTHRQHTMDDELRILHARLPIVAKRTPQWTRRLTRLLEACDRLGSSVPVSPLCGIHRDFYHDQVLIDHARLYLLDFDLYCRGNPGLDIGNFIGHLTEYSLRRWGDPAGLAAQEDTLASSFLQLAGKSLEAAVRTYTTLALVRHIHLSTILPGRQVYTEQLLALCEQRLDIGCALHIR